MFLEMQDYFTKITQILPNYLILPKFSQNLPKLAYLLSKFA